MYCTYVDADVTDRLPARPMKNLGRELATAIPWNAEVQIRLASSCKL